MSPPGKRIVRDAIWEAMINRAEALHDKVVDGQAGGSSLSARKIGNLAGELCALAHATALLNSKRRA